MIKLLTNYGWQSSGIQAGADQKSSQRSPKASLGRSNCSSMCNLHKKNCRLINWQIRPVVFSEKKLSMDPWIHKTNFCVIFVDLQLLKKNLDKHIIQAHENK